MTSNVGFPQQQQQLLQHVTPPGSVVDGGEDNDQQQQQNQEQEQQEQDQHDVLIPSIPDEETQDGIIRNLDAIAKIRDTWIYKQVRLRQDEFTNYRQALFYVGTWNVNAKGKSEDDLSDWLLADWNSNSKNTGTPSPPDIVAVGFQEIVDLNAANVVVDNKTQQKSQFWCERLHQTLNNNATSGSGGGYTLLAQKSMVGLLVCVFVKAVHKPRVKYLSATSVGVGVMGMMGNKGGVSVRLQFYDSTLCFVCSHLAAHRENVTGRNADFQNVYSKTSFEIGEEAIREVIRSGSLSHWAIGSSSVGIPDHDLVFWLGDLNYRIDESMPTETVLRLAEKCAIHQLEPLDQLNIERAAGRVLRNFQEGRLTFAPTYKYQPGTHTYDQRPEKKVRAPAWCDRILWTAQEPKHVQQLTYNRSELPNISDHKPVYSTLRVTIKDVVQQKREAIYEELMRKLDRYENKSLPIVGLDRVSLDFGEIRYGQRLSLPIQITNRGIVVAQFRLVPKLDEHTICKPWMSVSPTYGMLIPGEETVTLDFSITIDNNTAQNLNSGREVLEDILILRLEGGRDYYITVRATYARSCFGMSVDELVLYSEPIRTVPLDPIQKAATIGDMNATSALCVPKELWRLVDAVHQKGLATPGIFIEAGLADEVTHIRECLDTGTQFGTYRIHSYSEALLSFLGSLSSPIIPPSLFPTVEIDSLNIQSMSRRVLEDLAPINYNVLVYIISFFREALRLREQNGLTAAKVARICSQCLSPTGSYTPSVLQRTGMQLIILHLLETSSI